MQQEQIAKSVLLNLFWQHIIVKLSNVFKNDTEFYFVMIKQHPPGLIKKSPRRGIEPRSGTRQAPILTIKLSRILIVELTVFLLILVSYDLKK